MSGYLDNLAYADRVERRLHLARGFQRQGPAFSLIVGATLPATERERNPVHWKHLYKLCLALRLTFCRRNEMTQDQMVVIEDQLGANARANR